MKRIILKHPTATFIFLAFLFSIGSIGFSVLDGLIPFVRDNNIMFLSLIWQLVFFICCLGILKLIGFEHHRHKNKHTFLNIFSIHSIIIIVILSIVKIGHFDFGTPLHIHAIEYLDIILLALCEEYLYRGLAFTLFKQTDRFYSISHVMYVNFIFALTILLEIFPAPQDVAETVFLALYYFSFGVFLTASHLYTKSVLLPTLIHVAKGILTMFITLSVSTPFLPSWVYFAVLMGLFVYQMAVGCFYLLKNPHRTPKNFTPRPEEEKNDFGTKL